MVRVFYAEEMRAFIARYTVHKWRSTAIWMAETLCPMERYLCNVSLKLMHFMRETNRHGV